jgi:uncharacterized protein involved in exopolysaccharide biosynthesis
MDSKAERQMKPFFDSLVDFIIRIKPYAVLLWSRRKYIAWVNGSVGVLSLFILFVLVTPYYQSTVTILPDFGNKSSDMLSQFASIASLAGVNVGGDISTQIYQNLVTSETVLGEVIYKKYQTKDFKQPVDLIEYFIGTSDTSTSDSLQKRKMFLNVYELLLKDKISVSYELKTKILTVTVEMPESKLSADVANAVVASLDKYVRTQRKSFATEQRKYLDSRVQQIKDTLTRCEGALKSFREKNRQITQSPELLLEQNRLMRDVEIHQTIFIELTKQLELVKLAEVKDVPIVNIRELAKEPITKTGPKRVMTLAIILIISFMSSSGWIAGKSRIVEVMEKIKRT